MTGFFERSRATTYRGMVISVDEVIYRTPSGDDVSREIVRHMGAVVVVPYDLGHVYLIRQFRAATGDYLLELPAGKRDVDDEPPEVTAVRECLEEVGVEPGRVELIHRFWNSPGFCDELTLLYVALDLEQRARSPQGPEEQDAEIVRMPLNDALSMVDNGDITDAKTIIGLYGLDRWHRRGSRREGDGRAGTRGVDHVGLSVLDLSASQAFFEDCLGWKLVGERPDYPAAFVSDGTTMVTLWQVANPDSAVRFDRRSNVGLHHLALRVSSQADLHALFHAAEKWPGVAVEFGPELSGPGPKQHAMVYEPGGNRIELAYDPRISTT